MEISLENLYVDLGTSKVKSGDKAFSMSSRLLTVCSEHVSLPPSTLTLTPFLSRKTSFLPTSIFKIFYLAIFARITTTAFLLIILFSRVNI